MPLPAEAFKVADAAYTETLVGLRLRGGGGFKVAAQQRQALEAALNAAAPFIQAQTLDIAAESLEARSNNFIDAMNAMVGQAGTTPDDVTRYGAYAGATQADAKLLRNSAKALRSGE